MAEAGAAGRERRYDRLNGRWILFAPERGARPGAAVKAPGRARRIPSRDCPFCPGNEALLPAILRERGATPDWSTRIVPNRYPVVAPGDPVADGRHEVVIETPAHDRDLAALSDREAAAVIRTWRDRYREHARTADSVVVFRNYGGAAGASVAHPHSQIVALARTPPGIAARERRARKHHARTGRCLVDDMAARERRDGGRLVAERPGFVAFVPFAAEVPFETWIVPTAGAKDFGGLAESRIEPLAVLIRDLVARLSGRTADPAYNMVLAGASRGNRRAPWHRWFVRLRPLLVRPGGLEIATGITVNPSLPERDAAILKC